MKTFGTYDDVDGLQECRKTATAHAKQMNEPFEVETAEGVMRGEPGDYLMRGVEGELYVCDESIFEDTYAFIDEPSDDGGGTVTPISASAANSSVPIHPKDAKGGS